MKTCKAGIRNPSILRLYMYCIQLYLKFLLFAIRCRNYLVGKTFEIQFTQPGEKRADLFRQGQKLVHFNKKPSPESIPSERFSYIKIDSAKQAYYKGLRVVDRNREFLPSKYFYRRKEYRELQLVLDRNFHRRKV